MTQLAEYFQMCSLELTAESLSVVAATLANGGVCPVTRDKIDPRLAPHQARRNLLVDLCWAASEGDVDGILRLMACGVDLEAADYDGRTALHLAASEGRAEVVDLFVRRGIDLTPVDRWGNTPLDDARRGGHREVIALLDQKAARAA